MCKGGTVQDNNGYVGICFRCGHAVTRYEMGAHLNGTITDFESPNRGELDVVMCRDCWNAVREVYERGLEHAIKIRNEMTRMDKEDKEKRGDPLTP